MKQWIWPRLRQIMHGFLPFRWCKYKKYKTRKNCWCYQGLPLKNLLTILCSDWLHTFNEKNHSYLQNNSLKPSQILFQVVLSFYLKLHDNVYEYFLFFKIILSVLSCLDFQRGKIILLNRIWKKMWKFQSETNLMYGCLVFQMMSSVYSLLHIGI